MKKSYRILTAVLALLLLVTPIITVSTSAAAGFYTISWHNGAIPLKLSDYVLAGTTAAYRTSVYGVPSKPDSNGYTYTFIGFNTDPNAAEALNLETSDNGKTYYSLPATESVTYYAIFKAEQIAPHTVSWYNGLVKLKSEKVNTGASATYNVAESGTPTKTSLLTKYEFAGWSTSRNATVPEITSANGIYTTGEITSDVTYYAVFKTATTQKYTVFWKNYDESLLGSELVKSGSTSTFSWILHGTPSRPADSKYAYKFVGWSKEKDSNVTVDLYHNSLYYQSETVTDSDITYYAVYEAYEKTSSKPLTPALPTLPTLPTLPSLPGITPTLPTAQYYSVHWLNYDGTLLHDDVNEILSGTTAWYIPAFNGTPEKPSDKDYDYKFIGWSEDPNATTSELSFNGVYYSTGAIYKETTYYAIYKAVPKSGGGDSGDSEYHSVHWLNYDGSVLHEDINEIRDGGTAWYIPAFNGVPTRPADTDFTYNFIGWSTDKDATEPMVLGYNGLFYETDPIYEDLTLYAIYEKTEKVTPASYYLVTWMNGYIPLSIRIEKGGTIPEYSSLLFGEPTKLRDADFTYEFAGWSTDPDATEPETIEPLSGNTTYYAVFKAVERTKYTVLWKNYDDSILHSDEEQIYEGGTAIYSILLNGTPKKPADKEYTYVFEGWNTDKDAEKPMELEEVLGTYMSEDIYADTTYYAIYSKVPVLYTVTWFINGTPYADFYTYGAMPECKLDIVKPDDDDHSYIFCGWDKEIVPVTGNVTYTAIFKAIDKTPKSPKTGSDSLLISFAVVFAACAAYAVFGMKSTKEDNE